LGTTPGGGMAAGTWQRSTPDGSWRLTPMLSLVRCVFYKMSLSSFSWFFWWPLCAVCSDGTAATDCVMSVCKVVIMKKQVPPRYRRVLKRRTNFHHIFLTIMRQRTSRRRACSQQSFFQRNARRSPSFSNHKTPEANIEIKHSYLMKQGNMEESLT
jgi:hypothetical protein